jgi:hypothetical protein
MVRDPIFGSQTLELFKIRLMQRVAESMATATLPRFGGPPRVPWILLKAIAVLSSRPSDPLSLDSRHNATRHRSRESLVSCCTP